MYKSFTIAMALVAMAEAGWVGTKDSGRGWIKVSSRSERKFLDFCSQNNKFPTSTDEFVRREQNFIQAEKSVEAINLKARDAKLAGKKDPVIAAINWTADLDHEEYLQLLGLRVYEEELERDHTELEWGARKKNTSWGTDKFGRRRLIADALTIDWVKAGKMTPVKNQG